MKFLPHLGLDLGSKTIKLVQLSQVSDRKYALSAIGMGESPQADNQMIAQLAKAEAIKKLLKDFKISSRQAVIDLPESLVYTRVIEMPPLKEPELSQAIKWQAEQYIPVPLADVVLKHQVISQSETDKVSSQAKMTVLLIAAPNQVLNDQISLVEKAGLEVMAVETEILAVARAIIGVDEVFPTTLLVHIGAETTTLSILSRGDLMLTQSISSGSVAVTRSIATEIGVEYNQAEEYKKSYGLDASKLEGKVATAIKPVIGLVIAEIKKVLAFYETHSNQDSVKRVVISGGGSMLVGITQYLTENLGLEVQIGNPFQNISLTDKQKQEIGENAPLYTTAVGLALKFL